MKVTDFHRTYWKIYLLEHFDIPEDHPDSELDDFIDDFIRCHDWDYINAELKEQVLAIMYFYNQAKGEE